VDFAPVTLVQPDVVVVLAENAGVITRSRTVSVPELVIEVVSPGAASYDRRQQLDAYARAGVRDF
jgi:Uma2 family endonuclease